MDVQSRRDGQELYEFGEFTLDVPERRLTRGALRVHLAPKTYDVLVALVRRAGHLVTKRELLDRIWPDVFVEEGIVTVHVASLRKALSDMREIAVVHRDRLAVGLSIHRSGRTRRHRGRCRDQWFAVVPSRGGAAMNVSPNIPFERPQ